VRELDQRDVDASIAGGSVLACGGGGWVEHGRIVGATAVQYGRPRLVTLDELDDDDLVFTVMAIGAPAAIGWEMQPRDYVRAAQLLIEKLDRKPVGTITAQNGSSTTLNGFIQSAALGTLVVDAAGDGRAHPTAKMGSMGLTGRPEYRTTMAAAGGNRAENRYLEVVVQGPVAHCEDTLRTAADRSGGFIAGARNPLPASFVREHGAIGAISYALDLGARMLEAQAKGADAVVDAITSTLGGEIVASGKVSGFELVTNNAAFDVGGFDVGGDFHLTFVNEYMTVERGDERVATFPDAITTLSPRTGFPLSVADLRDKLEDEVLVLVVDKSKVPLGAGVLEPSVYPEVEAMLGGKELASYLGDTVRV
jgi:DUF917 family protein